MEASDGNAIPVNWEVRNEPVVPPQWDGHDDQPTILLPRINKAAIIEYIERHLSAFRGTDPEVAVNSHVCEYHSPPVKFHVPLRAERRPGRGPW